MRLLQTEAFVFCNGKIYASSMRKNGLYVYDIATSHSNCIGIFEGSDLYEWRLHRTAVVLNEHILFLPDRSNGIHRFNLKSNQMDYFPLELDKNSRFSNGIVYGNTVYCVQVEPKLEILTYELDRLRQDKIPLPKLPDNTCFANDYHFEDGILYLADKSNGIIVIIDCNKREAISKIVVDNFKLKAGFGTICKVKDDFIFSTQSDILIWNSISKETRYISDYPEGYGMKYRDNDYNVIEIDGFKDVNGKNEQPFSYSFYRNGSIVFLACRTNMCLSLNLSNDRVKVLDLPEEEETVESLTDIERTTHVHYICNPSCEGYPFYSTNTRKIYTLNNSNGCYGIRINDSDLQWNLARNGTLFWEDKYYGIEEYARELADM